VLARQFCRWQSEHTIGTSPLKLGRLRYSYTGVWRELERASNVAKIGHLGTHTFRHTYRSWLGAVGTPVAVLQQMMRHADIRTTFNIYGDVVTDEMTTASSRVAQLAFQTNGAQTERTFCGANSTVSRSCSTVTD